MILLQLLVPCVFVS